MSKVMIASVYDAFRAASVPDDKARAAAEDLAAYDNRFGDIERRIDRVEARVEFVGEKVSLLQWMVGINMALTAGVLVKLLLQ